MNDIFSVHRIWGTTPEERQLLFPCDNHIENADAAYRGVTIEASVEEIFRWLCQMRVAPYSYDWIDNFGKKSPQKLTPGVEKLAVGQTIMTIFNLVEFTQDVQMTIRIKPKSPALKLFGDVWVSYMIIPQSDNHCRLLAKIAVNYPKGVWGRILQQFLIFGDFIMMRRQLLNFKKLSEATNNTGV